MHTTMNVHKKYFILILIIGVLFTFLASEATAQQRNFAVHIPFTGIEMGTEDEVHVDVNLRNMTNDDVDVKLEVERDPKADNWDVRFVSSQWGGFGVSRVRLGTGDENKEVNIKLRIKPGENAEPGNYKFIVKASANGVAREYPVFVHLKGGKVAVDAGAGRIDLETKYPVLEGAAGKSLSFEIKAKNNSDKEVVVDFVTVTPSGWNAYVTPRWETDKRINSIKITANSSETLNFTVVPPIETEKGEYPLEFHTKAGDSDVKLDLKVVVEGTYKLQIVPETRRLNFDIVAGKESQQIFYVWNEGSAPIENISFLVASKPEDWEITFKPDKIGVLEPLAKTEKPEIVEVIFKAPERTIPGDYQVVLTAAGDQDKRSIELRATVKVPTTWGWIGVGIIIVVIALLFGIFAKLKRR
jgi:uncharacterized membrane protein